MILVTGATGPEAITQAEQVRLIGAAIGRPLRWAELSPDEVREVLLTSWGDPAFVDAALDYWASLVDRPEPVTGTVEEFLGTPARTFAQWAVDNADRFRRHLSTASIDGCPRRSRPA